MSVLFTASSQITPGRFPAAARQGAVAGVAVAALCGLALLCAAAGRGGDPTEALAEFPGCIGARSIDLGERERVMFAWFEDRAAVTRWCNSEHHQMAQAVMHMAIPDFKPREPLSAAPDEPGPFLVISTMKSKSDRQFGPGKFPLEFISMELYRPVPGGMFVGKRFAPSDLRVEGMREVRIE